MRKRASEMLLMARQIRPCELDDDVLFLWVATMEYRVLYEVMGEEPTELLGSELLVHSEWAGSNIVAKISTNTLIKPHTDVELALNGDKILIFDESCGDRI